MFCCGFCKQRIRVGVPLEWKEKLVKVPDSSYFGGPQGQFKLNQASLNKGIKSVTGAFDQGSAGPFKGLWNYVSGTGALQAGDDTGTLSLSPGGSFELRSPQGFGVTGNPAMKSVGITVPVGSGSNKGTVGLQGSWGADPSIQANFQFGQRTPSFSSPEQAVNAALTPENSSYNYQTPFNTVPQQNWNIGSNTSKEDMAQSMWFAPRTARYSSQYNPNAMNPEVEALRDKYVQRVQSGSSSNDMDSLTDWLPKR